VKHIVRPQNFAGFSAALGGNHFSELTENPQINDSPENQLLRTSNIFTETCIVLAQVQAF
jgi:hypothetical protein